jgi:hypothetical protein
LVLAVAGCTTPPAPDTATEEDKVKASLAKLDPEDRKLAEEQKFCAIETEHRLGAMGVPHKVVIKGQPIFLCCKGCEKEAKADEDKTLAKVIELRTASAGQETVPATSNRETNR